MGILIAYLRRAALIGLGAVVCWLLARRLGPWPALAAWAAIMAAACAASAWLLKGAPTGQITWRNRLAGYLIPWGFRIGRGKLVPSTIAAWAVWVLIGAATVLLLSRNLAAPSDPADPVAAAPAEAPADAPDDAAPDAAAAARAADADGLTTTAVLLFISWVTYGGVLVYLLGHLSDPFRTGGGRNVVRNIVLVVVVLLAASAALYLAGRPGYALLVAGGPIALLGGAYGLFFGALLLFGRNVRWN